MVPSSAGRLAALGGHQVGQPPHQLGDPLTGHRRDDQVGMTGSETAGVRDSRPVGAAGNIGVDHGVRLGAHHQTGPVEQVGLVAPELVEQHPVLLGRRRRR